jgi:hypothetical protein
MRRTTAFTIILGLCGYPVLAADAQGNRVPQVSLKDAPTSVDSYRHIPANLYRHLCEEGNGIRPSICETAVKPLGAPEKPAKASGAR